MNYVIIGGGPCGDSAIKEIRKNDQNGSITLISEENFPPYRRLSLTKQAWNSGFDGISLKTENQNINFVSGTKAIDIDIDKKEIICDNKKTYPYDKVLIATGISPRKLPNEGIIYLRTFDDFEILKSKVAPNKKVLVIGAGFTGLELASALTKLKCNVSVIYREDLPCKRILPIEFCEDIVRTFKNNGVNMLSDNGTKSIEKLHDGYKIITNNQEELFFDFIVASIGNNVNIPFSEKLICENGIVVNEFCETNIKDVYAAGDVAQFNSEIFDIKMRKEFMDNALKMGKCAALNMCGLPNKYNPIINTFFDAFDLGYKAVGEYGMNMAVSTQEVGDGKVVFYKIDNVIKGILFWGVKPALAPALKIITDKLTLSDEEYLAMMKY